MGMAWTTTLLTVTAVQPPGSALVTMATMVGWRDGAGTTGSATPGLATAPVAPPGAAGPAPARSGPVSSGAAGPPDGPAPSLDDLPGLDTQAARLREWLDLGFHHQDELARLGAGPQLGILVTGPAGSGKTTLVQAVAAAVGARLIRRWAPGTAALAAPEGAARPRSALAEASGRTPAVLLVEDVDALAAPEGPGPLPTV